MYVFDKFIIFVVCICMVRKTVSTFLHTYLLKKPWLNVSIVVYSSQNRNFGLTSDQKARGKLMIGEMPDTVVVNVKKIIIIILIKHFISRNYSHSSAEV